jgi:hypothetical protein
MWLKLLRKVKLSFALSQIILACGLSIVILRYLVQWHVSSGVVGQIVEAPLEMQKIIKAPDDILRIATCPTAGNAAGYFDATTFTGLSKSPKPLAPLA